MAEILTGSRNPAIQACTLHHTRLLLVKLRPGYVFVPGTCLARYADPLGHVAAVHYRNEETRSMNRASTATWEHTRTDRSFGELDSPGIQRYFVQQG